MTTANTVNENVVSEPARDVKFTCTVARGEKEITIKYSITNTGAHDIYVLDAYPFVVNQTTATADLKGFYLSFREPSTAVVLKGIPPLPSMPVTVRVMPLGTRLASQGNVSRELSIPLPLRERSDWYYAPLPPESYLDKSVDRMIFNLQFIRDTADEFVAYPAPYAPEFFVVTAKNMVKQVETVRQEFQIDRTQIFVRQDLFPRL